MDEAEARHRFAEAPVGRLATVGPGGVPHVVPICFAVRDGWLYSAVDSKPKTTIALRRLENIARTGLATVLVDHYEEDWSTLWWVRAGGRAQVVHDHADGRARLRAKYPQYATHPLDGPVVVVELAEWRWWSAG